MPIPVFVCVCLCLQTIKICLQLPYIRFWDHRKQNNQMWSLPVLEEKLLGVMISFLGSHGAKVTLDLGLRFLGSM